PQRASVLPAGRGDRALIGQDGHIGRVPLDLDSDAGDGIVADQIEDFRCAQLFIVDVTDLDVLGSNRDAGRPDVVEALAQGELSAQAVFVPVFADALGEISGCAKSIGLIENVWIDKVDARAGELR